MSGEGEDRGGKKEQIKTEGQGAERVRRNRGRWEGLTLTLTPIHTSGAFTTNQDQHVLDYI